MGWIYGNAIQRKKLRIIRTLLLAVAALASPWPVHSSFGQEKQIV